MLEMAYERWRYAAAKTISKDLELDWSVGAPGHESPTSLGGGL